MVATTLLKVLSWLPLLYYPIGISRQYLHNVRCIWRFKKVFYASSLLFREPLTCKNKSRDYPFHQKEKKNRILFTHKRLFLLQKWVCKVCAFMQIGIFPFFMLLNIIVWNSAICFLSLMLM